MARRKRGYGECLCRYCCSSASARRYIKSLTRMNDRAYDKRTIREEYDDYKYGIDPD